MKTSRFFSIFLLLTLLVLPSQLFAFNSSYECIANFVPDTGNMNETGSLQKFSGSFAISTKSSEPNDYKASGEIQRINVAAYISWRNDNTYQRVFSSSFLPIELVPPEEDSEDSETLVEKVITVKNFSFNCQPPATWAQPRVKVAIVAKFGQPLGDSLPTNNSDRGDMQIFNVNTPPPLSNVNLGVGSTAYEGLTSFNGSLGEVDIKTGSVRLQLQVLVGIYQNPLAGAYDPTPEGVAVFADLTGGTNPTTSIYGETKLAGAYWQASGIQPTLPFNLPFTGSWLAGPDLPGEIVGGVALAWGSVPVLGQNMTWGQQNRIIWRLPPRTINFTPDIAPDPDNPNIPTFTIYDGCSFGGTAEVVLRTLQVPSRVTGFSWTWGDGSVETINQTAVLTSHKSKVYRLANPTVGQTFLGNCAVSYQNSDTSSTRLEYPFKVIVKPLPYIYVPTDIAITDLNGAGVAYPGEDVRNNYHGIGSQRLICYENYNNPSKYYFYYKITDGDAVSAKYPPSPSSKIVHTFTTLGTKYLELYVHYKKAQVINNRLVDLGWENKLLASREVRVESQQVLEGNAEQRITFKATVGADEPKVTTEGHYHLERTLTLGNTSASITFDGIANIFYARRDENSTNDLDQKSGVKPDSVWYRWRVLDANGKDAYLNGYVTVSNPSLMSFTHIPNKGNEIQGITVTFKTPFGTSTNKTRFYKVFLEAKYNELAWKPVYHGGKVIAWEDDPNYKNNKEVRKIISIPFPTTESSVNTNASNNDFNFYTSASSEPILNKEEDDLLYDGSLGWEVRINDEIPAKVALNGISEGTTGDLASPKTITAKFEDNNPDAQLKYLRVIYKRYDEAAYAMSNDMYSDVIATEGAELKDKSIEYINSYLNGFTSQSWPSNIDESITIEASSSYTFELASLKAYNSDLIASGVSNKIALYADNDEWFPNSFATNMRKPSNPETDTGTFYYRVRAYYDDGRLNYIESSVNSIVIKDNDAPSLRITVVNPETGIPRVFEIKEELHDIIDNTNINISVTDGDNPLFSGGGSDSGGNEFFTFENSFTAIAHQRFLCNIEVIDNVLPPQDKSIDITAKLDENDSTQNLKAYLKQQSTGVYKSTNPQYLFYMKPGNYNLQFTVKDTADKVRKVQIPLEVLQEKDAKIRILKQQNEK